MTAEAMGEVTEFFAAIKEGRVDEVARSLDANPALLHARSGGLDPLIVAAYHGQDAVADLLLSRGLQPDVFSAAARGDVNRLRALLAADAGAVSAVSPDGWTPLHLAAHFGQVEAARLLLAAGARVDALSGNSQSNQPLHASLPYMHVAMVRLLLEHGAEVNARQSHGFTPLHAAAQNGDLESIQVLLEGGADPSIPAENGKTALDLARDAGKSEAVSLLGVQPA